ncbi:MAG: DNA polymerase Y family protein [Tepidisphaeraceae bacterium]
MKQVTCEKQPNCAKQVMCVQLPYWPIDRVRRRRPGLRHKALALIESTNHRQTVTALSPEAPPPVAVGMMLAQAKAHCSALAVAEAEPDKDRRALEALGHWLKRFSPNVAIGPPFSIWLDATGLELLFGNLHTLAARVDAAMKRLHISAAVAIAPTPGAAWALAAFGENSPIICSRENLLAALSRLPPQALRLDAPTAQTLHALGIGTIGILLRIPRDELVRRFGPALLARIDQATGALAEPLNWLPHRTAIQAEIEFDGVVESFETLELALRQVVDEAAKSLAARGLGARQLRLILRQPYAPAIEKTVGLLRSSRNAAHLFMLLRHTLENLQSDEGFSAVRLSITSAERLGDEQTALIAGKGEHNAAELDHLIERLAAKFGEVAEWAELVEAHVPEWAFCYRGQGEASAKKPATGKMPASGSEPRPVAAPRPLCLLPSPRLIAVMVTPSESRDGRPVAFTDNNQAHQLAHVHGPERIAGQWWNGSAKTRDYFDVSDAGGSRFWVFRVMESNQWYLHGIFE